jgi:hypothetical protein
LDRGEENALLQQTKKMTKKMTEKKCFRKRRKKLTLKNQNVRFEWAAKKL